MNAPTIGPQLPPLFELHFSSSTAITKNATYENGCKFLIPQVVAAEYQAISMTLKSCTIPVSWYMIGPYNNTMVFTSFGTTYTATLTQGNYTALTFALLVAAAIATATAAGGEGTITVTIAYSTVTGKYTYTRSSNPSSHSWGFTSKSTCLRELGFYNATAAQFVTTGTVLTSPNVVDLTGTNTVFIDTNVNGANYDSTSGAVGGILARIPVSVQFAGVLDPAPNFPTTQITDRSLEYVTVTLLDQYLNIIAATTPWQITILVSYTWDLTHSYFTSRAPHGGDASSAASQSLVQQSVPEPPTHAQMTARGKKRGWSSAVIATHPDKTPRLHARQRLRDTLTGVGHGSDHPMQEQHRRRRDQANSAAENMTPSSEMEPTDQELQNQDVLTSQIAARGEGGPGPHVDGHLDPQVLPPDEYPEPSERMLQRFRETLDMETGVHSDPMQITNGQKRIFSLDRVGPNTVHTSNAGPGTQN